MSADEQIVIACDDQGNVLDYIPKKEGHINDGRRHLAIGVLLSNSQGDVLLQKRKHQVFDNIWDITGATHPLHLRDHDESFEEAAERCLEREYCIPRGKIQLEDIGAFNYLAKYKDGLCENEHCAFLVGEYNGDLSLNDEVGYGYKWMKKEDFLQDIKKNPTNYSPWAIKAVKLLDNVSN